MTIPFVKGIVEAVNANGRNMKHADDLILSIYDELKTFASGPSNSFLATLSKSQGTVGLIHKSHDGKQITVITFRQDRMKPGFIIHQDRNASSVPKGIEKSSDNLKFLLEEAKMRIIDFCKQNNIHSL